MIPGGGGGGLGSLLAFGVGGVATASATVASRRISLCKQVVMSNFMAIFVSLASFTGLVYRA